MFDRKPATGYHLYSCDKLAIGILVVFGSILIAGSGRGVDYFFPFPRHKPPRQSGRPI